MGIVMKQFIDKFKAMEKVANETLAADPEALVGVDSMPGSEHDQKVPQEAKKPDAEVAQGQPAGAESAAGAVNGGDAKPLNEGKLEMDQPLENPVQKPLISDDALTAKTANEHLISIVGDLLSDLKAPAKQASCGGCGGEGATHAAAPSKPAAAAKPKAEGKKEEPKAEKKATIEIDQGMLDKIAAAQAAFKLGREAAEKALKKSAEQKPQGAEFTPEAARALIKESCIKVAQEQGLDPAAAAAAADNAMLTAGMPPAEAAAAGDAAGADAAASDAAADAGAAEAAADAQIPDDVTEEELATAIVDLVQSGELDVDTAKALVEEIAGDEGAAGPTEDQAAEIIAQGLESGEITPEQAQEIAAAVEGGGAADDAGAAAEAGAAAADAEAQGAADAEAAAQDAKDEAAGAAAAEEAIKDAAAHIRADALSKVASAIVAKRAEKQAAAKPGFRVMSKVAGILKAKKDAKEAAKKQASAPKTDEDRYIAGFKKKAEEMGVDPQALAKYVCDRQAE